MLNNLPVKVGPQFYQYHIGAIDVVPALLEEYHAKNVLIVHGTISWEKAKPKLVFLTDSRYNFSFYQYTGECSYYGSELLVEVAKEKEIDFIIGVGGGKLVDLVGYSSHLLNTNFGVIPTMASNCAPWTSLSVMYKENGDSEDILEFYFRQAAFLITDPTLVIDSPVEYFVAGIADTLAKWYESNEILQQEHLKNEPFLQMAEFTSVLSKEVIIRDSAKAIQDMKDQTLSDEFVRLSEIVFGLAGMIGGMGDWYARSSGAHAMHDAISTYLPESHRFLHGEKVAYGILYQLAIEKKWDEIDHLLPFYKELNLPLSLNQMNIYPKDQETIDKMVDSIDSKEEVHRIPIITTKDTLRKAIYELEKYMEERV